MATQDLLSADTAMGVVTLLVADLDAMTRFYRDAVTLQVLSTTADSVTLGRSGIPVVVLQHAPELAHASARQAGLFHTAILFETEGALAAAVYSVAQNHRHLFSGSSDHRVSKAFYFDDPEGNGIELYWDRDRSEWSWVHGAIEMSTQYLDPTEYLREHLTPELLENPVSGGATIGHVHLSVGDTDTARDFYVNQLGFEKTIEFPGQAVFVSAGGYHHHMAMNVWNSRGAGRRSRTLGLGEVNILVPSRDDLGALTERMRHFGVETRDDGKTVTLEDPWANLLRVGAAAESAPHLEAASPLG